MDDLNNANQAGGVPAAVGDPTGGHRAIDRRTMLKVAVATGVFAGTWVAPRIQTLGFAPAAAAGTPCVILSPAAEDKQKNTGQNNCPVVTKPCCGVGSFGSASANNPDEWHFENPIDGCDEIVVRLITLDCDPGGVNPDVGQMGIIISSVDGPECGSCSIADAVLVTSSGRMIQNPPLENGTFACPEAVDGVGVDISVACNDMRLTNSSRLAVRITCEIITGECDPQAPNP